MPRITRQGMFIAVLAWFGTALLVACGSTDDASSVSNEGASGAIGGSGGAGAGADGTAGSSVFPGSDGGTVENEICHNGIDDDSNGQVDENCPCFVDEQACYPGPAYQVGAGICTLGLQRCIRDGEFGTWGPCEDATLPGVDDTCNGIDEDCNGIVDDLCECLPGELGSCGALDPPCEPGMRECQNDGTWGECFGGIQPELEVCNGVDDDCNGLVDDLPNCACVPGTQEPCGLQTGECEPGIQVCQAGGAWSDCIGGVPPGTEVCNGKDDDCDGLTDPGCQCLIGDTVPCAGTDEGQCEKGVHACQLDGTWSDCQGAVGPQPEICGNNVDDDCDGQIDNGCPTTVTLNLNIDGDCVTASCPSNAPFPVGCNVTFSGGDSRGCVASSPGSAVVYFQEGNQCGAGHVSGTLSCSSEQGGGLNAGNCPINKPDTYYPSSSSGCPDTSG